jgi:predicted transcriptional regulator
VNANSHVGEVRIAKRLLRLLVYHIVSYTYSMAHAVSVRLDDEVQRALNTLEASGMSRSEAIRKSILDAATALRRKEALRAEVAALEADEEDRREMQEVAALMESLRASR